MSQVQTKVEHDLTDAQKAAIKEFVERNNRAVLEPRVATDVELRRALKGVHNWFKDVDGTHFLRSVLGQIPYVVAADAPVLKPPVSVIDVLEARLGMPHPDYHDPLTDFMIDFDVQQKRHALQSAAYAMEMDWNEEVIVAALIHDFGKLVRRQKHCYFAAEMFKPYVSEKIYFLIRYHFDVIHVLKPQPERLRESGTLHPSSLLSEHWTNRQAFKEGARVPNRLGLEEEMAAVAQNEWYLDLARVRQADDEGRIPHYEPDVLNELKPLLDRHVKIPRAGLGFDRSSAEELWKLAIEGTWMT